MDLSNLSTDVWGQLASFRGTLDEQQHAKHKTVFHISSDLNQNDIFLFWKHCRSYFVHDMPGMN